MESKRYTYFESGFVENGNRHGFTGMRPVIELIFSDFLLVAADQIFNQAAKIIYISGGQVKVPGNPVHPLEPEDHLRLLTRQRRQWRLTFRDQGGRSSTAVSQRIIKTAIRDDNPVLFLSTR